MGVWVMNLSLIFFLVGIKVLNHPKLIEYILYFNDYILYVKIENN